jgi:hypothetical protein
MPAPVRSGGGRQGEASAGRGQKPAADSGVAAEQQVLGAVLIEQRLGLF